MNSVQQAMPDTLETTNAQPDTSPEERARFERYLNIVEHEFPLEFLIAGELAQFETFAIPSMSKLLHRTRQYEEDGLKRLDDTRATVYDIFTKPSGHPERERMLTHLNWVHSHYTISNDDNLYTILRTFFHPIEWIEKHGWRKLTRDELEAMKVEMLLVGRSMNIEFPSEDIEALRTWQNKYRAEHQVHAADNQYVAEGTVRALQEHVPKGFKKLVGRLVPAFLYDTKLITALGLKQPSKLDRVLGKRFD